MMKTNNELKEENNNEQREINQIEPEFSLSKEERKGKI